MPFRWLVVAAAAWIGLGNGLHAQVSPPTLTSVSPRVVVVNTTTTLDVAGTGFDSCTRVRWNGQDLATTYLGPTALQAQVRPTTTATATITVFRYSRTVGGGCSTTGVGSTNSITVNVAGILSITTPSTLPVATRGQSYSQQLQVSGGWPPYVWVTQSRLPAGLTLSSAGLISGTPSQIGTSTLSVLVADCDGGSLKDCGAPQQAQRDFILTVVDPLQITTTSLPNGTVGVQYSAQLNATGGTQPYRWGATGLPSGLSIDAQTGVISGTPSQAGNFSVTLQVRDAQNQTASRTLSLTVFGPLRITTTSLPNGTVGVQYSAQVQATGGSQPYSWAALGLPSGLSINAQTGIISGTPSQAGSYDVRVQVRDAQNQTDSGTFTLTIAQQPTQLQITTTSLPNGTVGAQYSTQVQATGGTQPYRWGATGLPSGLSIDAQTGVISGTPAQAGNFNVTLQVRDAQNQTASRPLSLTVFGPLQITTTSLPNGTVGAQYSTQVQATGGSPPYSWAATGLPSGLSINAQTGVISGTPAQAGNFNVTLQVRDAQNQTASQAFVLLVQSVITIMTQSLPPGRVGVAYDQTLVAAGGVGTLIWSIASGSLPPGLGLNPSTGSITGTPTTPGNFTFTIQVRDANGVTDQRSYTIPVTAGGPSITTDILPEATEGVAYSAQLAVSGGASPYTWLALSPMPAGLSLDRFGQVAGTPTTAGTYRITVRVVDAGGASDTREVQLIVNAAFRISTQALQAGVVNTFYNQNVSAVGGRQPYTFGIDSGQLPAGLSLNPNTGAITGTPTRAGDFTFTVFVLDADQRRATKTFTITVRGTFRITTETLPDGVVGTEYAQTLSATGGASPLRWTVAEGSLPPGLSLDGATGALRGTPTQSGQFRFTIQVSDANNQTARQAYVLNVVGRLDITTQSLPGGVVGVAYSASLEVAGGEPPYRWSIATGALPEGLQLDAASGSIRGTPTRTGDFQFVVQVADRADRTSRRTYTIAVVARLTITTTSLPSGTVGVAYSVTLQSGGGSGPLQWRLTAGALPPGLTLNPNTGAITGTPSRSGLFTFTIGVQDNQGARDTREFSLRIEALALTGITIAPGAAQPNQQPGVSVRLGAAAPAEITGTLSLAFQSDVGVTDPAIRFSTGPTATFRIPRGEVQAVFDAGELNLQTGTVAGTITITARLSAGGVDITPSPPPTQTIRIERAAPVIRSLTARRSGNTITVEAIGFATSREVTSGEFQFQTAPGANVGATSFTVPLGSAFTTWYNSAESQAFGSQFRLTVPFTVTGDPNILTGVSLVLVNAVGRSQSQTTPIQ